MKNEPYFTLPLYEMKYFAMNLTRDFDYIRNSREFLITLDSNINDAL